MPEIKNITVQSMDEKCPICNKGYMRPTGIIEGQNPPMYQHRCQHCGYQQSYSIRYPYIVGQ